MAPAVEQEDEPDIATEAVDAVPSDARTRIAQVKQGLRSILAMLDGNQKNVRAVPEEYELKPPPTRTPRPEVAAAGARATADVAGRKVKRATA
jgi:hypothetical protein